MAQAAILIVILAAAMALDIALSRDRVIDRRVRRSRRLAIAELPDGMIAAVRGRARPAPGAAALAAPLSRRACLYYEVEVQAFDPIASMWVIVHAEARGNAFLLEDDSAAALVEPGGWLISVDRGARFTPISGPTAEAVRVLLARRGLDWLCRRQLRARERLLQDGQLVAALAAGMREPDPDPAAAPGDYRASALRPVLRAGRGAPLYITDHVDS